MTGSYPDCADCDPGLAHDGLRCGYTGQAVYRDESCDLFTWADEQTRLRKERKGTTHEQ